MSTRLISIPIALLAAALLIAGCGGSDDSTTVSKTAKADFLKEADLVCWNAHNASYDGLQAYIKKNSKDFSGSASPAAAQAALGEAIVTNTVPAMEKGMKELEALEAPDGEEEKVQKFVAAVEKANQEIEAEPESKSTSSGTVYGDANKIAREYDFGRCAQLP